MEFCFVQFPLLKNVNSETCRLFPLATNNDLSHNLGAVYISMENIYPCCSGFAIPNFTSSGFEIHGPVSSQAFSLEPARKSIK